MSDFLAPILPASIITSGKWYQPYIHSTPHTYAKSQELRSGDVKIEAARRTVMSLAKATFKDLREYYFQRELQLMKTAGVETHQELKDNLHKVFNNFTEMYRGNVENSAFGIVDDLVGAKKLAKKLDDRVSNPTAIKKSLNNMINKVFQEEAKKIGAKKVNTNRTFKSETVTLVHTTASWLAYFAKQHGIDNFEDVLVQMTAYMVYGTKPKTNATKVAEFLEAMKTAEPSIQKMIDQLQDASYPYLKANSESGKNQRFKGDERQSINKLLSTKHGMTAEAYVTDMLSALIESKNFDIINALPGTVQDVSRNTKTSISDSSFSVNILGETVNLGVDIKATSAKKKNNKIKYKRGEFVKPIREIFEMINQKTASTMMYLIANSYYFKNATGENSFDRFIGAGREIYPILNAIRALYALLPPNQAVATDVKAVSSIVKTDDRFVVIIDGVVFLMTEFLDAIEKEVLKGGQGEKSIRKLENNLATILDAYNTKVGGVNKKLYKDKLDLLSSKFKKINQRQGAGAYKALYNDLVKGAWGESANLAKWTYKIESTTFTVKK